VQVTHRAGAPTLAALAAVLFASAPGLAAPEGGKDEPPKATPYKEQFKDEILVKGARGPLKDVEVMVEGFDRVEWKGKSAPLQKKDAGEVLSIKYADLPTPFQKGMDAFRAGSWNDAETELRGVRSAIDAGKARKFWEARAQAYIGECRRRDGLKQNLPARLKEAASSFEDALRLDPKSPILDMVYLGLAECQAAASEWDPAFKTLDDFRKVAVEGAKPVWEGRSRLARGRFLERKGEVGGAATEYADLAKFAEAAALKADAESADRRDLDGLKVNGLVSKGWALYARAEKSKNAADLEEARKHFEGLPAATPGSRAGKAAAANGIGGLLLLEGKPQKALEKFMEVEVTMFQVPEETARALWYKAKAYDLLGNAAGRAEALKDLSEFYPSSEWAVRTR
jgi:tetratricopeptide (TPR) repeat protein